MLDSGISEARGAGIICLVRRPIDSEALVLVSSQRRQNFVQSRHSELWDHDCLVDRLTWVQTKASLDGAVRLDSFYHRHVGAPIGGFLDFGQFSITHPFRQASALLALVW